MPRPRRQPRSSARRRPRGGSSGSQQSRRKQRGHAREERASRGGERSSDVRSCVQKTATARRGCRVSLWRALLALLALLGAATSDAPEGRAAARGPRLSMHTRRGERSLVGQTLPHAPTSVARRRSPRILRRASASPAGRASRSRARETLRAFLCTQQPVDHKDVTYYQIQMREEVESFQSRAPSARICERHGVAEKARSSSERDNTARQLRRAADTASRMGTRTHAWAGAAARAAVMPHDEA